MRLQMAHYRHPLYQRVLKKCVVLASDSPVMRPKKQLQLEVPVSLVRLYFRLETSGLG